MIYKSIFSKASGTLMVIRGIDKCLDYVSFSHFLCKIKGERVLKTQKQTHIKYICLSIQTWILLLDKNLLIIA